MRFHLESFPKNCFIQKQNYLSQWSVKQKNLWGNKKRIHLISQSILYVCLQIGILLKRTILFQIFLKEFCFDKNHSDKWCESIFTGLIKKSEWKKYILWVLMWLSQCNITKAILELVRKRNQFLKWVQIVSLWQLFRRPIRRVFLGMTFFISMVVQYSKLITFWHYFTWNCIILHVLTGT